MTSYISAQVMAPPACVTKVRESLLPLGLGRSFSSDNTWSWHDHIQCVMYMSLTLTIANRAGSQAPSRSWTRSWIQLAMTLVGYITDM